MSLVWESEPWWTEHLAKVGQFGYWRVKRSDTNPALLAYFQNANKASRNVWTQIKPGRYLAQFLSNCLNPKQIKYWAEWQAKGTQPTDETALPVVHFADTPDDNEKVYLTGPASCMFYDVGSFDCEEHPTRIYGAGDLAIAHTVDPEIDPETPGHVIARAICWPERKVFGRVYPTVDEDGHAEDLRAALYALGYRSAHECDGKGLDGARMLRIQDGDKVIMPYLDAPYHTFDDEGDVLILRRDGIGEFTGTNTDGTARLAPEYEYTCENCAEGYNDDGLTVYMRCNSEGGYRSQYWCSGCTDDNTFTCTGFNEVFPDGVDNVEWNGDTYTQAWIDNNTFVSDFSGERFSDDDAVSMVNGDTWSDDEFDRHGQVLDGENWPNDDVEAEIERRAVAADTNQMEMIKLWLEN